MYILYIIFLEKLRSYISEIINIILTWAICSKYFKYLYHLIKDLLIFFLDAVMIASNIISFKLNFIFNAGIFINIFYFYIIKDTAYLI